MLLFNSQNTSGTNTYSGHIGLDHDLSVTQSTGGSLNITQLRSTPADTTTGFDIKGFTTTFQADGNIFVSGTIYNSTGSGNVIKNGNGVLTYSSANTYTGTTAVSSGKLLVNATHSANGDYSVASNATLGGNGTVNFSSAKNVNVNGAISPGSAGESSIGSFTLGTNVMAVLNSTGSLVWRDRTRKTVNSGTNQDLLNATVLNLKNLPSGDQFTIKMTSLRLGQRQSIRAGAGGCRNVCGLHRHPHQECAEPVDLSKFKLDLQNFQNTVGDGGIYLGVSGNDLVIVNVPEPNAMAVVGTVGAILGLARRRR